MKKIFRMIKHWRYSRLYRRLLWLYISETSSADEAAYQASTAFQWITGYSWTDWLKKYISPEALAEDKVVD